MLPNFNPEIHHRQTIRLKGYDYGSAGLYFITLCTHNRAMLFGHIENGQMVLNAAGQIANQCWFEIPNHYPNIVLHEFVVMPNHIHGIIQIVGAKYFSPNNEPEQILDHYIGANDFSPNEIGINDVSPNNTGAKDVSPLRRGPSGTIGAVVRGYKIGVTKWMRQHTDIQTIWQRNYWEHIIRDENSFQTISCYIKNNPAKWENDKLNRDYI
jgi:REP element-mobilizing transposase RayT